MTSARKYDTVDGKADNTVHAKVTETATTTVKQTDEGTVTTTVRTVKFE